MTWIDPRAVVSCKDSHLHVALKSQSESSWPSSQLRTGNEYLIDQRSHSPVLGRGAAPALPAWLVIASQISGCGIPFLRFRPAQKSRAHSFKCPSAASCLTTLFFISQYCCPEYHQELPFYHETTKQTHSTHRVEQIRRENQTIIRNRKQIPG